MKIVILGAGQVGRTAAYHLSREEANEVTVVDTDEEILRDLQDRLDIRTVAGKASYPAVLEAAGCAEADILIALTSSDEVNIVACEVAFTLFRTPTKIARIRAAEYINRPELFSEEARIVAIYSAGRSVTPSGDTVVEEGDEVFFLAARNDIRRVMSEMRKEEKALRRLVIAGGGNIGFRLAKTLEKHNQVKIIERDPKRARRISELLENTIVLNGDAADEELLIEENIDGADVFAALTNSEEANILSSMLAKRLGARKVMALINKPSYAELIESGSIDIAVSPQMITIGSLLAHVRRGDVVRVHSLRRGAAEALEAIIHGDDRSSRVVGKRIDEIKLPDGAAIGAVVRGERVIMAHHDTVLECDDHVILFLSDRRHVEAVERLFLGPPR